MLKIWFNRTYATNYYLLNMIRNNPDGVSVKLYATHQDLDSPVLCAADIFGLEPNVTGEEYVKFALAYCLEHHIDIAFPVRHANLLAAAADKFMAQGTLIATSPTKTIDVLDDKISTYQTAPPGVPVPPWRAASNKKEFLTAIASLKDETNNALLCMKPAVGVGGNGFRMLTDKKLGITEILNGPISVNITDMADALHAAGPNAPRMIILPYLDGPEISVDILTDQNSVSLAAIAREKPVRRRVFRDDPFYQQQAQLLSTHYNLRYISNIQYRLWQKQPVLLEINTRPSGGVYHTGLTNLNLPWAAVQIARGLPVNLPQPDLTVDYLTLPSIILANTQISQE